MRKRPRLWRDGLVAFALLFFLWLIAMKLQDGNAEILSGPFHVIDGDTISQSGRRLRLIGLDAPELKQDCGTGAAAWPCGIRARDRLRDLLDDTAVCRGNDHDKYGRLLVSCRVAQVDPAAQIVEEGLAVSTGVYDMQEARARLAGRGLWAGDFVRPSQWRRQHAALEGDDAMTWMDRLDALLRGFLR